MGWGWREPLFCSKQAMYLCFYNPVKHRHGGGCSCLCFREGELGLRVAGTWRTQQACVSVSLLEPQSQPPYPGRIRGTEVCSVT